MSPNNYDFPANPTVLNALAPPFPPPLSAQPPSPYALQRAFLNPPFIWRGVPLRAFRLGTTANLSELAPPEEKGHFYSVQHQKRYKSLKKHLQQDLEDLARRHKVENKLEQVIRAAAEEREVKDFHNDFIKRLEWGQESSPLLVRVDPYVGVVREGGLLKVGSSRPPVQKGQDGHHAGVPGVGGGPSVLVARFSENGQGSPFPSVRTYFRNYPAISISLAVADFYRRLERKREEFGNALEFQQMWEWSERHWNFYEAVTHLRGWVRGEKAKEEADRGGLGAKSLNSSPGPQDGAEAIREYDGVIDWSLELEARKRRHQWAVLRRIKEAFEINEEDFPDICAPAGRTLDSYFAMGRYGLKEKDRWYPVDLELEGKGEGGITEAMEQISCFEDVLEAGGTLAQASLAVINRNLEKDDRVTYDDDHDSRNGDAGDSDRESSTVQADPEKGGDPAVGGPPEELIEASVHGDSEASQDEPDPLADSNGDGVVNSRAFIGALRNRLTGGAPELDVSNQQVQGWLESWRTPKVVRAEPLVLRLLV